MKTTKKPIDYKALYAKEKKRNAYLEARLDDAMEASELLEQKGRLARLLLDQAAATVEQQTEELRIARATVDKLSAELTAARNFEWRKANARAWGHH